MRPCSLSPFPARQSAPLAPYPVIPRQIRQRLLVSASETIMVGLRNLWRIAFTWGHGVRQFMAEASPIKKPVVDSSVSQGKFNRGEAMFSRLFAWRHALRAVVTKRTCRAVMMAGKQNLFH